MSDQVTLLPLGHPAVWARGLRLATQAVRARWVSVALLTAIFAGAGFGAGLVLPRTYESRTRLLVQRNVVMPALASPTRSVPSNSDAPTQAATEFVLNRPALEGILERADLMARWAGERPPALRLKDQLLERLSGPISPEDRADALVEVLSNRLTVSVNNDVITINATWWTPGTALDIVNAAAEAFLEARRKVDVQAIDDTAALLGRSVEEHRARLEAQMAVVTARVSAPRRVHSESAPPVSRVAGPAKKADSRLEDLRQRVTSARQAVVDTERRYKDSVRDAEVRLATVRAGRTERHPDVVGAQRTFDRLREEPEALRAARMAETATVSEWLASGGSLDAPAAPATSTAAEAVIPAVLRSPAMEAEARVPAASVEDGYSRALLDNLVATYQDLLTRQANAQVELATAKAAFRYRYSVMYPARLAKKASGPNRPVILMGALMAGLLAGLLRALMAELKAKQLLSPAALMAHLSEGAPQGQA